MLEGKSVSSTKNLTVLGELAKAGTDGLSAHHISLLSGLSVPSVFRALDELREFRIVENAGSIWKVVPGNTYAERASGLLDAERYMTLEGWVKQELAEVERRATRSFGPNGFAMVAFGSAIGTEPHEARDIDIMLVAQDLGGFNVDTAQLKASISSFSYEEIEDMWNAGDQFVQTTVAWGIIVRDPYESLTRLRISGPKKVSVEQTLDALVTSYRKELDLYSTAFKNENWEEAVRHREKLVDNLTRQWLLRVRVTPKSRTELAGQLRILCASLADAFDNLAKGVRAGKKQAEKADRALWRYRFLTTLLSIETPEFADLVDLLYGNGQETENALWTFLASRGFEVADSPEKKASMLVKAPDTERSVTIEVKSFKPGLDKKNVGIHMLNRAGNGENLCLVYNPYRDIPADERVYSVNPEVARLAEEKRITLIPSNAFFSRACDLLVENMSKSTWLESLLEITPDLVDKRRS